jgi:integrase
MQEPITLDFLFARYQRVRLPSPETARQIEVVLRSLRTLYPSAGVVETLLPDEILLWRDWLLNVRKVSFATWNNYLRHLKLLVNFGHESKILPLAVNHFAGVKRIQEYRRTPKVLQGDGATRLVDVLESDDGASQFYPGWFWLAVIRCLYYTGMRRKQLVSIR